MLQAIDLTKRYEDGNLALDSLHLEIKPGEIFFLLGANGAGKTTSINIFLNFIEPTSGHALIDGIDVMENPLETKNHVAFVSENVVVRQLHRPSESRLLCPSGWEAEPDKDGLL